MRGIVAAFLLAAVETAGEATPLADVAGPKDSRRLVWSDDFAGAELDRKKWGVRHSMNSTDCLYANDERTMRIEDGCLRLEALPSPDPAKRCLLPRGVSTHDRMSFKYGYLEMRARVPFRHGAWPSFWMQSVTDGRKASWMSEIDIFEVFSSTNRLSANLHKWFWDGQAKRMEHVMVLGGEGAGVVNRSYVFENTKTLNDEFHVYGFEWTPKTARFYVDGHCFSCLQIDEANDYAPWNKALKGMAGHHDFHAILLNNEVFTPGHGWMPSGAELKREDLPIRYEIDWIRLYQKEGEDFRLMR